MLDTAFLILLWGLAATYTVHLRLIGKLVLPIRVTWTLVLLMRRYERILIGNRRFLKRVGLFRPNFHVV